MTKILLTGATGYIGGSILSALLKDNHEGVSYGVLIRNAKAASTCEARNITPHLFQGLDDLETIERVAAEYDGAFERKLPDSRKVSQRILTEVFAAVINTASASHPDSAKALIRGLARRQKEKGVETFIIHVSASRMTRAFPHTRIDSYLPRRLRVPPSLVITPKVNTRPTAYTRTRRMTCTSLSGRTRRRTLSA